MNDTLVTSIRKLRLSGMLQSLEVRLQEAAGNNLSHDEFLELILQDELNIRQQRLIDRRIKAAAFRDLKTLEDFDFSFNPSIKRKQIFDLATCRFIREQRDVLFIGPPGVGKSHIAQAIGYHAIKAGFLVLYRSVFDAVRELCARTMPSAVEDRTHAQVPEARSADHRRHGPEASAAHEPANTSSRSSCAATKTAPRS